MNELRIFDPDAGDDPIDAAIEQNPRLQELSRLAKLSRAETAELDAAANDGDVLRLDDAVQRPSRATKTKCFCGCGRRAEWPREGKPYFHTRLCGYLMALKMVSRQTIS